MSAILETRDLSKHFGGLRAVDGVSLSIQSGDLHSIIGPNGAGKTTLFNLLSGALKPSSGQVLLRGVDITQSPPHRIAHLGIGRSYQITNIFTTLSVLENVRLAAQALGGDNFKLLISAARFRHYTETAFAALQRTGLADRAGQIAASLPHGDKRKLEVAILLAQDPEIMLLDEPTSGLASEQVPEFMELIDGIRRDSNKTIVLVEHNMNVVMSRSNRISVMHQGQLLAEGTPAEIAANTQVQTAYLGAMYGHLMEETHSGGQGDQS